MRADKAGLSRALNSSKVRAAVAVFCLLTLMSATVAANASFCSMLLEVLTPAQPDVVSEGAFTVDPWIRFNATRLAQEVQGQVGSEEQIVSAELRAQILELLDWMKSHLPSTWWSFSSKATQLKIQGLAEDVRDKSLVNWTQLLRVAADFSEIMGKFHNHKRGTLVNEDVLDDKFMADVLGKFQKYNRFITPIFTFKNFSFRNLNDASPYPVFASQIVAQRTWADGTHYYPFGYFAHDLAHDESEFRIVFQPLLDKVLSGYLPMSAFVQFIAERAAIYQAFRAFVESQSTEVEKEALEMIWFTLYHENDLDHSGHKYEYEMSRRSLITVLSLEWGPKDFVVAKHLHDRIKEGSLAPERVSPSEMTEQILREAVEKLLTFAQQLPDDHRGERPH